MEKRGDHIVSDGRIDFWLSVVGRFGPPSGFVIEAGCMPGTFLNKLKSQGYRCLGLEVSARTVAWIEEHTGIDVRQGIFPDVELPTCDLFLAFDVIEHSHDPLAFLRGVGNALNPGGIAILQSPIVRPEQGYDPARPFGDDFLRVFEETEHVFILSSRAVGELAHRSGLSVIDNSLVWHVCHEIVVLQKPTADGT